MKYKERIVVNDLNLSVNQGELFALLGPNGAGKTTTIKMLTVSLNVLLAIIVLIPAAILFIAIGLHCGSYCYDYCHSCFYQKDEQ